MEDVLVWPIGAFVIFVFLALLFVLPIVLLRWVLRINEQIELLTQIKDELRKLKFKKYSEREVEK